MGAPGAVQVLRAAQAARQSRRVWPLPAQVRLHSTSCCLQELRHAVAAPGQLVPAGAGMPPVQEPAEQVAFVVQGLPSSQGVPSGCFRAGQVGDEPVQKPGASHGPTDPKDVDKPLQGVPLRRS
jgi:hypothetical protein